MSSLTDTSFEYFFIIMEMGYLGYTNVFLQNEPKALLMIYVYFRVESLNYRFLNNETVFLCDFSI